MESDPVDFTTIAHILVYVKVCFAVKMLCRALHGIFYGFLAFTIEFIVALANNPMNSKKSLRA